MTDYNVRLTPGGVCFPEQVSSKPAPAKLSLKNEDTRTMLYKLKTSAPENYLVKPRFGKLAPGEECEIIVYLASEAAQASSDQQHRFQLEVRPTSAEEDEQLEKNKAQNGEKSNAERDLIGVLMRSAPPKVPKPMQFLLLTYVGDDAKKAAPEAQPRRSGKAVADGMSTVQKARPSGGAKSLDEELRKLEDEESQLLSKKSIVNADTRTLKEAASASAEESASSNTRLERQPPLAVPLWLAVILLLLAIVLGHTLNGMARDVDGLIPSPLLQSVQDMLGMQLSK